MRRVFASVALLALSFTAIPGAAEPPHSGLRQNPARRDVLRAMHNLESAIVGCFEEDTRSAQVRIVFAGDGRVRDVDVRSVAPAWPPARVVRCIERGARSARLRPFRRTRFSVVYPFRVPSESRADPE